MINHSYDTLTSTLPWFADARGKIKLAKVTPTDTAEEDNTKKVEEGQIEIFDEPRTPTLDRGGKNDLSSKSLIDEWVRHTDSVDHSICWHDGTNLLNYYLMIRGALSGDDDVVKVISERRPKVNFGDPKVISRKPIHRNGEFVHHSFLCSLISVFGFLQVPNFFPFLSSILKQIERCPPPPHLYFPWMLKEEFR